MELVYKFNTCDDHHKAMRTYSHYIACCAYIASYLDDWPYSPEQMTIYRLAADTAVRNGIVFA